MYESDLDLYLLGPGRDQVAYSSTYYDTYEWFDYIAPAAGTYTLKVHVYRWETLNPFEYIGLAWWHDLSLAVTHYYETSGNAVDRAPLTFGAVVTDFVWTDRNGIVVATVPQSSTAVPPRTSDVFMIQMLRDADGRLGVLIYGCRYTGTWVAACYFKFVIYREISMSRGWQDCYYLVRWTDVTPGSSADCTPDFGETFDTIAHGSPP